MEKCKVKILATSFLLCVVVLGFCLFVIYLLFNRLTTCSLAFLLVCPAFTMGSYMYSSTMVLGQLLNLLSSILTILLTCPNSDALLCYSNDPFLTVYMFVGFCCMLVVRLTLLLSFVCFLGAPDGCRNIRCFIGVRGMLIDNHCEQRCKLATTRPYPSPWTHTRTHAHARTCTRTHARTHTHTHTHTHTCNPSSLLIKVMTRQFLPVVEEHSTTARQELQSVEVRSTILVPRLMIILTRSIESATAVALSPGPRLLRLQTYGLT